MKLLLPLVISLIIGAVVAVADEQDNANTVQVEEEDNVYVLTSKNFDSFVADKDVCIVFFYAPWCGHCTHAKPHYHEAAKLLREDLDYKTDKPVVLAKVDATQESAVANRFDITGYPTFKVLRRGVPYDYDGPRQDGKAVAKHIQTKEAHADWTPPRVYVHTLTEQNFTDFVNAHDISLVEFYAPWCGHCKTLAPKYEKAAKRLAQQHQEDPSKPVIPLAKVDATAAEELTKTYKVQGYPTLYVFRKGRHYEYKGGREIEEIVSFMLKARKPQTMLVETFNQFHMHMKKPSESYILGLFADASDPLFNVYSDFASKYSDDFKFFHAFKHDDIKQKLPSVSVPSIIVYHHDLAVTKKEPHYHMLAKHDATIDEIEEFVMKKSLPLVGHLSAENKNLIYEKVRPICYVFYDVDNELKSHIVYIRDKVATIARKFKRISFVIANETEHVDLIKRFYLETSDNENNVVCFNEKDKQFTFDESMEDGFEEDLVENFVRKFEQGKLKPFLRSQMEPKDNGKRIVKTVVGKTFEKWINDPTKHVVLAVTRSTYCDACDQLEPLFMQLAKSFQNSKKPMLFAKLDPAYNDYPNEIYSSKRMPAIYFVPAFDKQKPLLYEGNYENLDDMMKFVLDSLQQVDQLFDNIKNKQEL